MPKGPVAVADIASSDGAISEIRIGRVRIDERGGAPARPSSMSPSLSRPGSAAGGSAKLTERLRSRDVSLLADAVDGDAADGLGSPDLPSCGESGGVESGDAAPPSGDIGGEPNPVDTLRSGVGVKPPEAVRRADTSIGAAEISSFDSPNVESSQ